MISRRFALLIPLAALAGCGAGRTVRVADGDTAQTEPVALAPTPAPDRETGAAPLPAPSNQATAADSLSPNEQGYAAYGNPGSLEIRRIGQWGHTGIGEARRMVIRDANAWAAFWSELGAGDRPAVDFTKDLVVAVASGQRSTDGYEIAVDRVSQADGQLTIEVVETNPGPNCLTTTSLAQPVDVVLVPAAGARSWSFLERKEIRACR